MKANELIIGGWYLLNGKPIKIEGYYRGNVFYDSGYECGLYELKHIPLTEDILKANGFLKNGEFPLKDHIKINYKDGWFITFCECYGYDIKFVHELQHALRLCGLNDLADNFKLK